MRLCVACVITHCIFSLPQWSAWLMWVYRWVQTSVHLPHLDAWSHGSSFKMCSAHLCCFILLLLCSSMIDRNCMSFFKWTCSLTTVLVVVSPPNKTWLPHFYYNKTMANFCKAIRENISVCSGDSPAATKSDTCTSAMRLIILKTTQWNSYIVRDGLCSHSAQFIIFTAKVSSPSPALLLVIGECLEKY